MKGTDWVAIKSRLAGKLSDDESRIVELLIQGKTMAAAGQILGQHRSMVWRKMQRVKERSQI